MSIIVTVVSGLFLLLVICKFWENMKEFKRMIGF